MNPLDSSHHLRIDEWCPYREGVVLNRPVRDGEGSWVNIGLQKDCKVDKLLEEKTRVTVKLNEKSFGKDIKFYTGKIVSMREPMENLNLYWGYTVRIAENFSELFENSIFGIKYDLILGTSDKGENTDDMEFGRDFKHCLIVFGGLQGIEGMLENDEKYNGKVNKIFDFYLNTCIDQGCRTIRTEEAMLISLALIKSKLRK
jgi:predicted SPOUT superfamily RNA methylase MTH1